jgi:Flp pilus assembly protein TadG
MRNGSRTRRPTPRRRSSPLQRNIGGRSRRAGGQALVEFALVIPLFLVLFTAVIEFGFLFNATLATSFGTRDASLIAAEAGDVAGGDCVILQKVEQDMGAPADPGSIQQVQIYWANSTTGIPIGGAVNTYTRTGSMTCDVQGVNVTVPYSLSGLAGYIADDRCNILAGCGADSVGRNHPNVDTIGISVNYRYLWHTPLSSLLGWTGGGLNFTRSNAMRMEPVL